MSDRIAEIQGLLLRNDLRTADQKYMQAMLRKLRRGGTLNYQEEQNLWAYVLRYTSGAPQAERR
jgi:hypothetical protein